MTAIRRMRADDAAEVAELTTQLGYPTDADEERRRIADIRSRTDDELLVAVDGDDRPIGWIHVARLASLAAGDGAVIHGLVVAESARSGGIGTHLVAAAEAWAHSRGAPEIIVRSRSTRERTHRFYERLGYAERKRSHVFGKRIV
jgi:GNAT superfamily N-acetyltransferase